MTKEEKVLGIIEKLESDLDELVEASKDTHPVIQEEAEAAVMRFKRRADRIQLLLQRGKLE